MKKHITLQKTWLVLFFMWLLALLPAKGYAGVMIGGTRFIYNEKSENGLAFLVRNTDETPYLIQTRVLPDKTKGNENQGATQNSTGADFVVTPPLLPLRKKQENYLRIIRTGGNLPADRESLFQLSVAAIPSGQPGTHDLQVAIRSNFKLLYRPAGLKGIPDDAYQQLTWQRHSASVRVENPTPYYVTLFKMTVNGKTQSAEGVVSPFSARTESWCPANGPCQLQWQSLDDTGIPTKAWNIVPVEVAKTGNIKL
ncbi:fimbrial biogenesis chaperone [Rahnella sp. PCH160]|uniref:fimbrial biogenesis chaperone n=1 Tax=Rahnella sp. PCH160 TaxID=3447928 RepID=UPI0039FB936A